MAFLLLYLALATSSPDASSTRQQSEDVHAIWVSPQQTVWLAAKSGIMSGTIEGFARVPTPRIFGAYSVWGTSDDDVWIPDSHTSTVLHGGRNGFRATTPLNGSGLGPFAGSNSKDIWVVHPGARSARLLRFDGVNWSVVRQFDEATVLSIVSVRDDVVWLVTEAVPPAQKTLILECAATGCVEIRAPANVVLLFGAPGDIWARLRDGGLRRFDGKTWRVAPIPDDGQSVGLSQKTVTYLAPDKLWLAGGHRVARWDGARWTVRSLEVTGDIVAIARQRDQLLAIVRENTRQHLLAIPDVGNIRLLQIRAEK